MRLATFNVENLFRRPVVLDQPTWELTPFRPDPGQRVRPHSPAMALGQRSSRLPMAMPPPTPVPRMGVVDVMPAQFQPAVPVATAIGQWSGPRVEPLGTVKSFGGVSVYYLKPNLQRSEGA